MSPGVAVIDRNSVVVRMDGLPTSRVDSDAVILNVATGRYVGLDEIGRRIWDAIETPVRVGDLSARLAPAYRETPDVIERDIILFLIDLQRESLIRVEA